ncbi:thioesterase family protein [Pseudovibrio exalbescens]|uniref:thioesterase family protein n=1 Tax=Pseudovibrio exalbescens TaxID=197461 RepID=UPI00236556E5|nr:thioesterase family protein [Pseudovibrio exalbescens]MDD7911116.1 thioesterase family protein [Pseudovibrio exalbescens]
MPALETLLSFVNTWECDENDHLNVQFYFAKFEEADRQFRLLTGFSDAVAGPRRVRHVRYHAELRSAVPIKIRSYIAFDGPHMLSVVHEMIETSTNEISATAIDGYTPNQSAAKQLRTRFKDVEDTMNAKANPRGVSPSPFVGKPTIDDLTSNGSTVTCRGTVLSRDVTPEGKADDGFAIGLISDAVSHAWERTPMKTSWLDENYYGRIAMEQKLTWISPLKTGDAVVVLSSFTGVQNNVFSLRHHIYESRTNRLAAVCDMVALTMDLEKRSIVPIENDVREKILSLQAS